MEQLVGDVAEQSTRIRSATSVWGSGKTTGSSPLVLTPMKPLLALPTNTSASPVPLIVMSDALTDEN